MELVPFFCAEWPLWASLDEDAGLLSLFNTMLLMDVLVSVEVLVFKFSVFIVVKLYSEVIVNCFLVYNSIILIDQIY